MVLRRERDDSTRYGVGEWMFRHRLRRLSSTNKDPKHTPVVASEGNKERLYLVEESP